MTVHSILKIKIKWSEKVNWDAAPFSVTQSSIYCNRSCCHFIVMCVTVSLIDCMDVFFPSYLLIAHMLSHSQFRTCVLFCLYIIQWINCTCIHLPYSPWTIFEEFERKLKLDTKHLSWVYNVMMFLGGHIYKYLKTQKGLSYQQLTLLVYEFTENECSGWTQIRGRIWGIKG